MGRLFHLANMAELQTTQYNTGRNLGGLVSRFRLFNIDHTRCLLAPNSAAISETLINGFFFRNRTTLFLNFIKSRL
jgi:hypothetical protein